MSVNEILPNLWLGDKTASQSKEFLSRMNIGLVVNCTKDIPFCRKLPRGCDKIRLPVDDNLRPEEIHAMTRWSPGVVRHIWSVYSKGVPVFIHCYAGVQRSAAITAMFLIFYQRCSTRDAIRRIRQRRPIAFQPGINFEESIRTFEEHLSRVLKEAHEM